MLLRFFKGTGLGVIAFLIITLAALWAGAFIHPQSPGLYIYETRPMPLYGLLKGFFVNAHLSGLYLVFPLVCFMLFLIVNFNTTQFFINERTFLPALFYLLYNAIFPACQVINPVLPASLFLMIALRRIIDSYRKPGVAYNFFDAGVLIGAGTLLYADLIWFGLILIIGILLFRSVSFTELVLSLLGLAAPLIITLGLYYVLGKDISFLLDDFHDNLFEKVSALPFSRLTIVVLLFTGLALLLSAGFLVMRMSSKKIKSRKTFSLLIWTLLIAAAIFVFVPSVSLEIIWIASLPASYLMAHYFVFERKMIFAEVVFSLLFVLILVLQGFYLFS